MPQKIYIRNMVCNRCIMVVEDILSKAGHVPERVCLGEVELADDIPAEKLADINQMLQRLGFEVIDDKRARLIEKIKNIIISRIHHSEELDLKFNWSHLLAEELHHDYNYLSSLFSSVEGITLEQYIIKQKIEKVKELLFYDELSLTEISYRLGYSSVAHLSAQFKKITGFTPSEFKKSREVSAGRKGLDSV